jgi:hypothetical protein
MNKDAGKLRNRKILRKAGTVAEISVVQYKPGGVKKDRLDLARKEDKTWDLPGGPRHTLKDAKIDVWIGRIREIRALDFMPEKTVDAVKKYGLGEPTARITFLFATPEEAKAADKTKAAETAETKRGQKRQAPERWVIELGTEKDGAVYARGSDIDAVIKLAGHDAETLRANYNQFRDERLPFKLAANDIAEIEVKTGGKRKTFKKDGESWSGVDRADKSADSPKVQNIVSRVLGLEAKAFLDESFKGQPKHHLQFKNGQGQILLVLDFGDEFTLKSGPNAGQPMVYARSSVTGSEALAVPANDVKEMTFDQLFSEPKPEDQAQPAQAPQSSGHK